MSKAMEWCKAMNDAVESKPRFMVGEGAADTPAAVVGAKGILLTNIDHWTPQEALELARWILDTFDDAEPKATAP